MPHVRDSGEETTSTPTRRVVMLVDNRVFGDSRVTKCARSAVAAGYEVIVLGVASVSEDTSVGGIPVLLRPGKVRTASPGPLQRVAGLMGHGDAEAQRAAIARETSRQARSKRRIIRIKGAGARRGMVGRIAAKPLSVGLSSSNVAFSVVHRLRARAGRYAARQRPVHATAPARLERRLPVVMQRTRAWEHLDPWPQRYRDGWLPDILALEPDLIHAHDYRTLPAAVAAKRAIEREGGHVQVVYDSHEFVQGLEELGPVRLKAAKRLERSLIRKVDSVITVSERVSAMLQESYGLAAPPPVVVNGPEESPGPTPGPSLRERVRVSSGTPLLIYSGSVGGGRALDMCVDALELLPEVHLALVVGMPNSGVMAELTARATAAGVRDRLHLTRYVPQEYIVDFIREATAGIIPLRRHPNFEHSLPTKAREYLLAGLPQVVSDVRELSEFIRDNGLGEVHVADDPTSFAEAVKRVLADRDTYVSAIDPQLQALHSWSTQGPILTAVYDSLLEGVAPKRRAATPTNDQASVARPTGALILPEVSPEAPVRLVIGPSNSAGQGWAWAQAASSHLDAVETTTVTMDHGSHLTFPTDVTVSTSQRTDPAWVSALDGEVASTRTHVILESGVTLSGSTIDPVAVAGEVGRFEEAGLAVGLALHGSEVRDPERHMARFPWSNFRDAEAAWRETLQKRVATTLPLAEWLGVPTFVSTLDLLDYVPWATWLPVTIDVQRYANDSQPFTRDVPVVVHAPSRAALKGTHRIDPVLSSLAAEGLIDYRHLSGIEAREMPEHLIDADIIVDQVGMGLYGALSCEGMAAGRLVMAQVGDVIRERMGEEVPIVEISAETLEATIRTYVADRERARETAGRGVEFVATHHDGRAAAAALSGFLGLHP
jgi:glycosyltransferase involved in cell wall biosynthesis